MANKLHGSITPSLFAGPGNLLVGPTTLVAGWTGAFSIALVNLRVGVTELDCNVPDLFRLESNGLDTRYGLHNSRLSVCDVTDSA